MSKIVLNGFGPAVKFTVSSPADKNAKLLVIGNKGVKSVNLERKTKLRFAA
jgi:hypothetical protein